MKIESENLIFALDIGTRSVTGIVGRQEGEMFRLLDVETAEHGTRTMLDGQIEDIDLVAGVAAEVKRRLSERLKLPLGSVNVAAAGRTLKTKQGSFELELNPDDAITQETVARLEMGAADNAAGELNEDRDRFFCVGHTVQRYYLDDYPIATLLEHRGSRIRAEIIATFLPREVVESLFAVVKKIGSTVESLTLEPIAALNAIIPRELMMLNLALVDIGAGTSDIAVTADGSVAAYTMVTTAGDEVTEALIRTYLVDFDTAEQMKMALSDETAKEVSFTDILGIDYTVSAEEVKETVRPVVEELSSVVSQKILEINGAAPSAVFLVGGGSKAPGMREATAKNLGMDLSKVAVGGNNYIKKTTLSEIDLSAPEYATPIGIAITAARYVHSEANRITVNDRKMRLFGNGMPMLDVLLSAGYTYSEIVGRVGKRTCIVIDGKRKYINGGHPEPASILLNGKACGLRDIVTAGDKITVVAAKSGADASLVLRDALPGRRQITVMVKGVPTAAGAIATVNGETADADRLLADGDIITTRNLTTLGELMASMGLDARDMLINGAEAGAGAVLRDGDRITRKQGKEEVQAAGKTETREKQTADAEKERGEAEELLITLNGESLLLPPKKTGERHLFVDLLNYVDIKKEELTQDITLKLNGRDAAFMDPLKAGDVADIRWR